MTLFSLAGDVLAWGIECPTDFYVISASMWCSTQQLPCGLGHSRPLPLVIPAGRLASYSQLTDGHDVFIFLDHCTSSCMLKQCAWNEGTFRGRKWVGLCSGWSLIEQSGSEVPVVIGQGQQVTRVYPPDLLPFRLKLKNKVQFRKHEILIRKYKHHIQIGRTKFNNASFKFKQINSNFKRWLAISSWHLL